MKKRSMLAAGLIGAAAIALAGCSSSGGSSTASTPPAPSSSAPAVSVPSPTAVPAPSGSGALTVSIASLPAHPSLNLGGASLRFTVSVRNGTSSAYPNITPVVWLDHCSCNSSPVPVTPDGTLQEQDPATGQWHGVFYDTMGSGTDYLNVTQQPGFSLPAGATAIFTFRVALDPPQSGFSFHNGQTAIDVTVETLPGRTVIGLDPAAKAPVSVVTG